MITRTVAYYLLFKKGEMEAFIITPLYCGKILILHLLPKILAYALLY